MGTRGFVRCIRWLASGRAGRQERRNRKQERPLAPSQGFKMCLNHTEESQLCRGVTLKNGALQLTTKKRAIHVA